MSLQSIKIAPGIQKETPSLTSEPAWRNVDKVRFKAGQPEKLGGWLKDSAGLNAVKGVARSMLIWKMNNGIIVTAIGTTEKVYIFDQNFSVGIERLHDITPLRETQALGTDAFDSVNTTTTVTVNDTAHGSKNNDYVTISGYVDGGLNGLVDAEVNGNHQITTIDSDSYSIEVTTPATATGSDGGASVTAEYEVSTGAVSTVAGFGYGSGDYGEETWGDPRSVAGTTIDLRFWSLDHFGEDLVLCHEGSRIYQWTYVSTFDVRAILLTNSPLFNNLVVVTNPDRHLVAFASESTGAQDKMLITWADQETTNTWTPTAENTAGDHILSGGSEILAVHRTQNATLIWTDAGLHNMQYIGPPFTFSFSEIGANCGAISKACVISKDSTMYWMGKEDFFVFDGVVKIIPCSVHRHVFSDINLEQKTKVVAGLIKKFDEIIWLYPCSSNIEIDRYVIFNYEQNIWYTGTLVRTVWVDSELMTYPIAINSTGTIYHHENGTDDDTSAMTSFIESAEFDVEEGDRAYLISRVIPDMTINAGSVDYIFKTRRYPQATQSTDTIKTVSASTEKLDVRIRTTQIALRIESDALSDSWEMGTPRFDIRPDGRRP